MTRRPLFRSILLLSLMLTLGGCESFIAGVATPMIVQPKKANLLNASYAAVDTVAQQSQRTIPRGDPLVVYDLREVINSTKKKPRTNPGLGPVLATQMRERFLQLGYNVIDTGNQASARSEMAGTYEIVGGKVVNISVRLRDRKIGRVVGITDYSLPVTSEIKKHMSRKPNSLPSFPKF